TSSSPSRDKPASSPPWCDFSARSSQCRGSSASSSQPSLQSPLNDLLDHCRHFGAFLTAQVIHTCFYPRRCLDARVLPESSAIRILDAPLSSLRIRRPCGRHRAPEGALAQSVATTVASRKAPVTASSRMSNSSRRAHSESIGLGRITPGATVGGHNEMGGAREETTFSGEASGPGCPLFCSARARQA
ncbi:hypothetical protein MTO96_040443, partial [Rhipicephalus appendiculatus]